MGPSDARSAATESVAQATAAAFGHPVVIDADTTPTVQVSALPDGTEQMVQNTLPVRVKTAGGWTPTDTDLVQSAGFLEPKATTAKVQFGSGGNDTLNQQVRLVVGDTTTPVAVASDASIASVVTGPFLIGSSYVGSTDQYQWTGLIADPTVFRGVASASQIDNLYYQSPPQ